MADKEKLKEKALAMPDSPGVYIMKDLKGRVLYVGKAKSLPKRVSTYFQKEHPSVRIGIMVGKIRDFDFMVTDTEKEALILENSLIKKHKPKYNIILRDDKTYPSIRLTVGEEWPRIEVVRKVEKDGSVYFGPFTSAQSMRRTIHTMRRIFPLRQCKRPDVKAVERPCLNYQLGRCLGPCHGNSTKEEYRQVVDEVILFFKGRNTALKEALEARMKEASAKLNFEAAARFRDRLNDVKRTLEKQKMVMPDLKDRDVFGLARDRGRTLAAVLHVRQGALLGSHTISIADAEGSVPDILEALLGQYYSQERLIPGEVLVPEPLENDELIQEWLRERRGKAVVIGNPSRGPKRKLLQLAAENAANALAEKFRAADLGMNALVELQQKLQLPTLPKRIECYDMSNLRGEAAVGAMVVLDDGKWDKSGYRRFKIKDASGNDDYAMMTEVLGRRLAKSDEYVRPDLILLDGGRGQLGVAGAVIEDLGITDAPPLAGLAKGRLEGEADKVWLPGRKNPVEFKSDSAGLLLLMRVRDESHRYVQSYHHRVRAKGLARSVLDDIPGIGPSRRKALLNRFHGIKAIREATVEELKSAKGMNEKSAQAVYDFFRENPPGQQ